MSVACTPTHTPLTGTLSQDLSDDEGGGFSSDDDDGAHLCVCVCVRVLICVRVAFVRMRCTCLTLRIHNEFAAGGDGGDDGDRQFTRKLSDILRDAGDDDDVDPVFADDPLSRVEVLPTLRALLVALYATNPKAFEAILGQCEASDRQAFIKIWPKQLSLHAQALKAAAAGGAGSSGGGGARK